MRIRILSAGEYEECARLIYKLVWRRDAMLKTLKSISWCSTAKIHTDRIHCSNVVEEFL